MTKDDLDEIRKRCEAASPSICITEDGQHPAERFYSAAFGDGRWFPAGQVNGGPQR